MNRVAAEVTRRTAFIRNGFRLLTSAATNEGSWIGGNIGNFRLVHYVTAAATNFETASRFAINSVTL